MFIYWKWLICQMLHNFVNYGLVRVKCSVKFYSYLRWHFPSVTWPYFATGVNFCLLHKVKIIHMKTNEVRPFLILVTLSTLWLAESLCVVWLPGQEAAIMYTFWSVAQSKNNAKIMKINEAWPYHTHLYRPPKYTIQWNLRAIQVSS